MMTHYPCDAAFGYLDLYKRTKDRKYLQAATRIADTYARTQEEDGTWPLVVDFEAGKAEAPNRMVPTWVIFLFDRLQREHGLTNYTQNRQRAWNYIERNPLKTFAWDAQFEDTKPRPPYRNLAREQSCDVATIIFENPLRTPAQVQIARELLRFGEDQFVVWSDVKDPAGWRKAKIERGLKPNIWIPPLVLEQYTCYMPVARSSAVFIRAYLAAYKATGEAVYLQKAQALGNSLIEGQQDQIKNYGGKGEIPTWVVRKEPNNWLNNSYYAAESLVALGRVGTAVQ
jgi:maltose/maltodextrin transport system substrate-binding protein